MNAEISSRPDSRLVTATQWIVLAISAAASLSLLGWVLLRSRSGFDFTDEGFYLNWISNPWYYHGSVSQFGFVYHPLYRMIGGDIALLRQINVFITFILSCALCVAWIRSLCPNWTEFPASQRAGFVGVAVVVASCSLSFLDLWLPTPNYNSLAFQSLMVATTGALLAERKLLKLSVVGWALIGIGGGFAFLAKPTTAAVLGFLIAGYIAVTGKLALRGLLISLAAVALILVIAGLAIDRSLSGFVHYFATGLDLYDQLLPNNGLSSAFRWDWIQLSGRHTVGFAIVLLAAAALVRLGLQEGRRARYGAALMVIVLIALTIATMAGVSPRTFYVSFHPMHYTALALGALLAAAFHERSYRRLSPGGLALIALLTVLPYSYAAGTGNNVWTLAARAGLFWVLAGLAGCVGLAGASAAWRGSLPIAAFTLLISSAILFTATENPYRQSEPLRTQLSATEINHEKSILLLTDATASYVRGLNKVAVENGFRDGDPVIDLTGVSPGSLYVMGARPLGVAWMSAGYPGSHRFLAAALHQESCDLIGASWILTEPDSPDSYPPSLLDQFGIDISQDYVRAGSIISTRSFSPQKFEHRLLKPLRSLDVAQMACENARRK